ncbi:MAG: HAD family hydrolase [Rhodobacteraceae bacterium]|nr:HAD family hydrolase [Paracoccaceae bacterium]
MRDDFDLVIFDCDGVLIDSEIISARMLVAALAEFGVAIDLDYVAHHFLGRSYPTVMRTIRSDFGIDLPPAFEEDYRARLLAAFETGLRIMPGAREVLEGMAVPWCVATSSSRNRAERSLAIVGLDGLVGRRLYTAGEVANGKPAPDLFLHAAGQMGVDPARALVIEDSLNGIRSALAAGCTVWRFVGGSHLAGRSGPEPADARPHARFARFDDFFAQAPALGRACQHLEGPAP